MVSEEDYLIFSGIKPGGEYLTLTNLPLYIILFIHPYC
jgi:hypothetical protein